MTRSGLAMGVSTLLLLGTVAHAAQLDKDTCNTLRGEQTKLEQGGLRGSMAKGPEWAKTNLPPDKLEQVRRLVEVDEQILFRCGGRPLVVLPPEADPDTAAAADDAKDDNGKAPAVAKPGRIVPADQAQKKAPAVKKAAVKPVEKPAGEKATDGAAKEPAKKAPAPKAEAAVKQEPAKKAPAAKPDAAARQATGEWVVGKGGTPKPKPKPKADDAFRPPPTDTNVNPFGGQGDPFAKK